MPGRWAARCALCLVAMAFARTAARCDELQVERKYRVSARQVMVDLEQRRVQAEGDAVLTYQGVELRADTIDADLRTGAVTAHGGVRVAQEENLLSADGVEYDLNAGTGNLENARGSAQGIHFAAQSLQVRPGGMVLRGGSFTTCDLSRPHYRVTAEQIILRPGDRLIARRAAVWYDDHRLLRLPNWSHSLRRGQTTSPLTPVGGFSRRDGVFAGFRYAILSAGAAAGELDARYTTARGLRAAARARTSHRWGDIGASLTRRDELTGLDLGLFAPAAPLSDLTLDRLPEVEVEVTPVALGRWGDLSARVAAGRYREQPGGVLAARGAADLSLRGRAISLGPDANVQPVVGLRGVTYDTHQQRSATAYGVIANWQPRPDLAVRLGYLRREAHGAGPFAFDAADIGRELDLGLGALVAGGAWRVQVLARRDLAHDTFPAFDVGLIRVAHCLEYGVTWRRLSGEFGVRVGLAQAGPAQAPAW
jgi:lipopolysaccharide export system protein LptA